ncbi:MAG: YybH family protein [Myxococcaceae bacterium]
MRHALVLLLLSAAPPPENQVLQKELQSRYDAYAAACVQRDLSAVMALLAPDVQWTLVDGSKLDRAGVEGAVRDFLKTLEPGSSAKYTIRSVKHQGDDVLVDVHLTVTIVQPDPEHAGKTVKHIGRSGWHDVWVKGAGGWLLKSGEEYELPAKKPS